MNIRATIRQHPVASFIILTLGLSFAIFLVPFPPEGAYAFITLMAVMIPTIVAFALVALMEGRRGAGAFLRQCFHWRCALKWYVIALVLGLVVHFVSSLLALLTGQITAIEITAPNAALAIIPIAALLEEIGWRGFALRRLLDRYSPFSATLLVGIPWALLHFALFVFFVPNVSPLGEGLTVLAFAFLLTWIFVKSARTVLVSTVLHSSLNAFAFVSANIPPAEVLWFVFASGCLVVAVLMVIDRRMWFARPVETKAGETVPYAA